MKTVKAIFIMTCILFLPQIAQTEENEESLKAIEITATRTSVEDENPASAMTVITQEEIKKKQHMQVKDILREQPGVNVVNVGPMGGTTTVFMRGAGSQSTLVLIDGAQVNSNTTGSFDFSDLQMDNIERIEILRGPQSTLWGADAVGGVINIVTKRGQGKPRHFLSFEAGSYSTVKGTLGSSGSLGKFDYSASASYTDSDGFSAFNEDRGATEDDGYQNTTFSTRLGHYFLKDGRIELIGRYTKAKNAFDGFNFAPPGPVDAPNHLARRENFYIALPIEKSITPQWDARLSTNFSYDELDTKDPTFGDSVIVSRTSSLDFQNNVSFGKYLSAILGFEYQTTDGNNRTSDFSLENRSQGYYLQGNMNWQEQAFLTVGIRQDINSQFEDPFTYKVEGAYQINSWGTKLRGSVATGFRVPSVNEVLFPFFGNPNIQPEKSKNWEVGFEQKLFNNRVTLGSNFFYLDFEDLIVFDFVTFIAQNIGSATSKGIETFFNFQIQKNLELIANYTWNQATDDSDGSLLPRRPRHIFSATLAHTWKNKLDSLITVNHRSKMESGGGVVGERTVVRAALAYQLNKIWKLTARGENLFNEKYEESFQFGTAGISGYAGFVFNFN